MTLAEELESYLPPGATLRFGQLQLSRTPEGSFVACHADDRTMLQELEEIDSISGLRDLAKGDVSGEFRPLKTAPTLRSGWKTESSSAKDFLKRLDAIYPGVFATWVAYDRNEHGPTSLRRTLDRQTGMYRFAGTITDQMANRIMRELCSPGCLRKIAWPLNDQCIVSKIKRQPMSIPVICTEACTFAVSRARELAKEAYDRENAPGN
ncbi:MAG: DR2241 family protein [Verrucomicrobiales bacterium]